MEPCHNHNFSLVGTAGARRGARGFPLPKGKQETSYASLIGDTSNNHAHIWFSG